MVHLACIFKTPQICYTHELNEILLPRGRLASCEGGQMPRGEGVWPHIEICMKILGGDWPPTLTFCNEVNITNVDGNIQIKCFHMQYILYGLSKNGMGISGI